jgi:hypothetical protein
VTAADSHARFAARCAAVPATVREALDAPLPTLPPRFRRVERWAVTATGASEGVGRALVWLLRRYAQKDAVFVPLSYFAVAPGPHWDGLVVLSQGVCPNARLALSRDDWAEATVVITASPRHPAVAARSDAVVVTHPPDDEADLLARVQGPAAAMVAAARFVDALMGLDDAPSYFGLDALPARLDAVCAATWPAVTGEVAFVTEEATAPVAHALRWKWLETVASCDPPSWDVLQFAHGPWQYVCERPFTIVTLEREGTALFDRLATMLSRERHTLVRLRSELTPPGCFVELDAMVNGLVCAALPASGRDLQAWPGRGTDGALYDVGG